MRDFSVYSTGVAIREKGLDCFDAHILKPIYNIWLENVIKYFKTNDSKRFFNSYIINYLQF